MIHWTGKGYLALALPVATAVAGLTLNEFVLHGRLSNQQVSGPLLVIAAVVLQYLIHNFPSLRMTEEPGIPTPEQQASSAYFTQVEPTSDRLMRFLKVKRHAPHTFMWLPLSAYPFIWGSVGVWQSFSA